MRNMARQDAATNASLGLAQLRRWQQIAVERAVALDLAELEVEEARTIGDPERITIADRYYHETKRMHAAAERKLAEFV